MSYDNRLMICQLSVKYLVQGHIRLSIVLHDSHYHFCLFRTRLSYDSKLAEHAIIFIFFAVALSDFTNAWLFYLGAFFVIIVMYSPGGVAALVLMNLRVLKYGLFGRLRDPYVGVLLTGAVLMLGVVMVVEMGYHLSLNVAAGSTMKFMGFKIDTLSRDVWVLAIGVLVAGAIGFEAMRRRFVLEWNAVQELIEAAAEREVMV